MRRGELVPWMLPREAKEQPVRRRKPKPKKVFGMVPTYVDCSRCGRLAMGSKMVPREIATQSSADAANGVKVKGYVRGRPVCHGCWGYGDDQWEQRNDEYS